MLSQSVICFLDECLLSATLIHLYAVPAVCRSPTPKKVVSRLLLQSMAGQRQAAPSVGLGDLPKRSAAYCLLVCKSMATFHASICNATQTHPHAAQSVFDIISDLWLFKSAACCILFAVFWPGIRDCLDRIAAHVLVLVCPSVGAAA